MAQGQAEDGGRVGHWPERTQVGTTLQCAPRDWVFSFVESSWVHGWTRLGSWTQATESSLRFTVAGEEREGLKDCLFLVLGW